MIHDRHGHWIAEAGNPAVLPPLEGDERADVVIVGGGYTGMWTAWHALEAGADVILLEAGRCGHGPSGRNGGFVLSLDYSYPSFAAALGEAPARAWIEAAAETVDAIGAWCEAEGVDAWFRKAGELVVSTAPAQDGIAISDLVTPLDRDGVRARCASPVFRCGVFVPRAATVHPARLAFGLRERLLARGARIYEGSRVVGAQPVPGGIELLTPAGHARAPQAVIAVCASSGTVAPLRNRLTVSSSHIVCTEPVPDVLEELGWTGGEAITDGRALLHYTRTTRDGRIVFGWGGGRMAPGARPTGRMEVDHQVIASVHADILRWFPQLEGRRMAHAWGGPIDVSPTHRPAIVGLQGLPAWAAFGYTGNGVGPAHLFGRTLAALALDRRDPVTRLPFVDPPRRRVPPEPLRVAGASLLRRAMARKEAAEEEGRTPDPVSAGLAALPRRLGIHIVR